MLPVNDAGNCTHSPLRYFQNLLVGVGVMTCTSTGQPLRYAARSSWKAPYGNAAPLGADVGKLASGTASLSEYPPPSMPLRITKVT